MMLLNTHTFSNLAVKKYLDFPETVKSVKNVRQSEVKVQILF
jgi:hypothetical protein